MRNHVYFITGQSVGAHTVREPRANTRGQDVGELESSRQDGSYGAGVGVPHNHICTSHREPQGQAATGSTGPGRSHSLLSGGPTWQPAHTSPSTSPHPPEVGPPHTAAWVGVCMCMCVAELKHCHLTSGYSEQGVLATTEHLTHPGHQPGYWSPWLAGRAQHPPGTSP